ncbi:unnamed protein product [Nezara viridula]|uniref:Uncharacterized protein n=1 Tax=Nezara viridula TaxID=85310 RepID=A0A9P0HRP7_NEZVI|nr:unnamed protein product [Nezara viridula]
MDGVGLSNSSIKLEKTEGAEFSCGLIHVKQEEEEIQTTDDDANNSDSPIKEEKKDETDSDCDQYDRDKLSYIRQDDLKSKINPDSEALSKFSRDYSKYDDGAVDSPELRENLRIY